MCERGTLTIEQIRQNINFRNEKTLRIVQCRKN